MATSPNKTNEARPELVSMLSIHLANMYSLTLRFQNFHWNVEGPQFHSLHALFEEHYKVFAKEVDITAERIRFYEVQPPATLREFFELSQLANRQQPSDANGMLRDLITSCVIVHRYCSETLRTSGLLIDEVTSDMLIRQLSALEKAIWMFRSSISDNVETDEDVVLTIERTHERESPQFNTHH